MHGTLRTINGLGGSHIDNICSFHYDEIKYEMGNAERAEIMEIQLKWNQKKMDELSSRLEKILFQRQEEGALHNTPIWNEDLVETILSGDEFRVRRFMEQKIRLEGEVGYFTGDSLRNFKNLIICSVSSISNKILREGDVDAEMVYSISDACIQMVEEAKKEEELLEVAAAYCLTLCRHIKKSGVDYHPLVRQVKEYVFKHFHEKIVIGELAKQLGTTPSYLGMLFRKSENMTLHQFIMYEKVERGKNLLRYSDYDLQEISQYLGFASQSHFGREFKKYTGYTPADYRLKKNQLYRKKL